MKEGQRVRLPATDECPEQFGTIIAVESNSVLVEIDSCYRDDEYDDGLRDVPLDGLEVLNGQN